jgi:hypothetical protein
VHAAAPGPRQATAGLPFPYVDARRCHRRRRRRAGLKVLPTAMLVSAVSSQAARHRCKLQGVRSCQEPRLAEPLLCCTAEVSSAV